MYDYGAPVGFRLATARPERVRALVVQNANAYEAGLTGFWEPIRAYWTDPDYEGELADRLREFLTPDDVRWQYTHGVRDETRVSPDGWTPDRAHTDRRENEAIQLRLLYDHRTDPPLYPAWQAYLREHQPPTLAVWGDGDEIFGVDGATAYADDVETVEIHRLDTGHFALAEAGETIAALTRAFLGRHLVGGRAEAA